MAGALEKVLAERIRRENRRWTLRTLVIRMAATGAAVYLLLGVLLGITVIQGHSMEPALMDGDMTLFWRWGNTYEAGDLVVLAYKGDTLVKRVIATAGDLVELDESGIVWVNGMAEDRDQITTPRGGLTFPLEVMPDHVLVLGDNRADSYDSRDMGQIPIGAVIGKLMGKK